MNMSIGENIKIMRRKCGFTQEELASRLSVTPQAVSKWENGNGTPDIVQLVPLAQIFGITTDSLLGVVSATYGAAHTEATLGHEKLLMSTAQPVAEKHLAAYTYFRAESEKEPTNYTIMRKCINHGAEISRYVDFEDFLGDKPELREDIFADCERKNACIARYCEDRTIVENSDFAMTWIYIHMRQFDKAKKLIDRLPSLESNALKESIMTQFIHFQYGFEKEKSYIADNIRKLLHVTAKEFFYGFEDYGWNAAGEEAITFGTKLLGVLEAYKAFEALRPYVLICENSLRRFLPRCYAFMGAFDEAAKELLVIARNYKEVATVGYRYQDAEEARNAAYGEIKMALDMLEKTLQEKVTACPMYAEAMRTVEEIR